MNNKGFTLVEILVVITLLALVIIIAIPVTQNISISSNKKLYETKMENITKSAHLWSLDNIGCLKGNVCPKLTSKSCSEPNLKCFEIKVSDLVSEGYLDYDEDNKVIDPRNKKENLNNVKITITYNENTNVIKTKY